jgi:hypothetical protein
MSDPLLTPIHCSVSVSWDPETAFRRFTHDFAAWWPTHTHSIGEHRISRLVFETTLGGRIFEEHVDGRRFLWGQITAWDPPRSVSFTWHPARAPETAQHVDVRFVREGGGTRLELTAAGWERWGRGARQARRGYRAGWGYILNVWAGRRTARMLLMDGVIAIARVVQWARGGVTASIARAEGAIEPARPPAS